MSPSLKRQAGYAFGRQAERQAAEHMGGLGYEILHERFKTPYGEIDLIARQHNTIVFVEVKARASETQALESLGMRQIKRIVAAAEHYVSTLPACPYDLRFDVITVCETGLTHLEHAFEKEWE